MHFGTEDLLRLRFAVSPLCQTHEAVRTLRRPARHGYHLPWLRRIRGALAGLDLSELSLLMPSPGYTPDFLGPPPDEPCPSFQDELARMRATDPAAARAEMANSLACTPGATESPIGRRMLADPAWAVRRLAEATEQAWQALVAPDWPRLRALLEADVALRSRQLAEGGLERLFADLRPELSWADGALTVRTRGAEPPLQRLDGRGLLLMPSVFVWPDVVSGFAAPWQPTVIYPARGVGGLWQRPSPRAAEALVRLLGPNRAAILGGLTDPSSTTALAERHRLAPSSVSAHLAVLRDAGLVSARRQGRLVLYERTPLGIALAEGEVPAG
ncbi:ArsR family transcriptional regulator [Streptomyces palmae]|uniref:ArsR family transcriptional regulator n=2 Tax=Streptomyces palmae TaxID=1701085 RepID=A0A4Z0H9B3_9ACTN|nr:ArsR family transcriptional regulator [Streptomyces palmae]